MTRSNDEEPKCQTAIKPEPGAAGLWPHHFFLCVCVCVCVCAQIGSYNHTQLQQRQATHALNRGTPVRHTLVLLTRGSSVAMVLLPTTGEGAEEKGIRTVVNGIATETETETETKTTTIENEIDQKTQEIIISHQVTQSEAIQFLVTLHL
jgi:hypothetical protein